MLCVPLFTSWNFIEKFIFDFISRIKQLKIEIGQTLNYIVVESFILGKTTKRFEDYLNISTRFHLIDFHPIDLKIIWMYLLVFT